MNIFSLERKSVLIVGGTSDIGYCTAYNCAAAGARLVLSGRNISALQKVKEQIKDEHPETGILTLVCDLSDEKSMNELVEKIPLLDGLVFCAGTLETLPCKLHEAKDVSKAMMVNFDSVVTLTAMILRKKKIAKGASIIFLSSIAGNLLAEKGNSLYGASKAALSAYARTLALELSNRKIRVNCVTPGMVETKFLQNFALDEDDFIADKQRYPLGYGKPEDVAYGVIYLLSDASRWITGTNLLMDGGRTLQ